MRGATPAGGASPLTTTGDIFGFDTADARIPVGADNEILIADSGEALGVRWGAVSPGGDFPVVRRRKNGNQSITNGSEINVTWDETTTIDAAVFEIPAGANAHKIKVLEDGVYSVLVRFFWGGNPLNHIGVVNGVDPDAFAGYPILVGTTANNQVAGTAGQAVFRLAADQSIYITAYQLGGVARNLTPGTFFEVMKVGTATLAGRDS